MQRILLTGGGSGGHAYPLAAVAEAVQKISLEQDLETQILFLGTDGILRNIASEIQANFKSVISPKWRRYFSLMNLVDIIKAPIAFIQSAFYVWAFMPDIIFSKGGYDSFFPVLAGKLFFIPVVVHETDSVPGTVNKITSKMAKKVFLAFDIAGKYFKLGKTEIVGNPIREEILQNIPQTKAREAFNLASDKPTVLITGASQGAKIINDVLLLSLAELVQKFQIIHQCGEKNYDEVNKKVLQIVQDGKDSYGKIIEQNYRLYAMFSASEMATAYAACDVVVSRGGGAIFEISAVGRPAVIIPLKNSASNHQFLNAMEFAKHGAVVIEEPNLTQHVLINQIELIYQNREEISNRIKQFASINAAQTIATYLLNG